jgi:hypothetical protein
MKNYKNISLLLLLSTTSITHAFDPYNTSGVPDVSDFDDQSGGPLPTPRSWDYGQTSLEKEVKKQNPTPPKSTVYPTQLPTKKDANPFFEKQRQRQEEEKRKKETAAENAHDADTLVYQLTELYKQIEYRNAALSEAESSYQSALENLTAQRKFGRYEKVGMITATLAAAAALVTTSVEDAPKYVVLALVSAVGTAWSYIPRYRSCNKQQKAITNAHPTELEQAATLTQRDGTSITKKELIAQAETTFEQLIKNPTVDRTHPLIQEFEETLNTLKA